MIGNYPKRLIEVDLPIARISAHARREKSIRHGHISTLHIWWARRPLAACRAVILASLWPDPVDLTEWTREGEEVRAPRGGKPGEGIVIRPARFLTEARQRMASWAQIGLGKVSAESGSRLVAIQKNPKILDDPAELRAVLLDFIADFANWDNSTGPEYLNTSRALTQAAHEALGGLPSTRPFIVDPFAGGGSIPLEALRVGADAFASDLNPVAVLLNKVALEYVPRFGQRLADEVRKWAGWVKREAQRELAPFYPKDGDGATPIAYLWARTIQCEGPDCGAEVPLIRSLWLSKRPKGAVALHLVPNSRAKRVDFAIIVEGRKDWADQTNPKRKINSPNGDGTVKRGSATCPLCGYTTPVARVREQLTKQNGGADTSRLMCVVILRDGNKVYRLAAADDLKALKAVQQKFKRDGILPPVSLPLMSGVFNVPLYGINRWDLLFSLRQLAGAEVLSRKVSSLDERIDDPSLRLALKVCLAIAIDKYLDFRTTLCGWISAGEKIGHTFGRQALARHDFRLGRRAVFRRC